MLTAVIDEDKCIGCSRCIPACPIDAIIGTNKKMHTVITEECIGCKLCLNPCPMDCIDIVPLEEQSQKLEQPISISKKELAENAKTKYKQKQIRLSQKLLPKYASKEEKMTSIRADLKRIRAKKIKTPIIVS